MVSSLPIPKAIPMKVIIKPFDFVKVKKTNRGIFLIPRDDFRELYIEKKPIKRKR